MKNKASPHLMWKEWGVGFGVGLGRGKEKNEAKRNRQWFLMMKREKFIDVELWNERLCRRNQSLATNDDGEYTLVLTEHREKVRSKK